MLGFAWLALRQAQEALKNGRLEEAQRLLCQPGAHGHKRCWELLQQVAQGFVDRGERYLQHENTAAAWNDLIAAEQMGAADSAAFRLRQTLTRLGLAEVRALLEAGEPGRALEMVSQLRHRSVQQPELCLLEEAAKNWTLAKEQAGRGEFAQALQSAARVRKLLAGRADALEQFLASLEHQHQTFSALLVQLHEAAEHREWREVIRLSEQALALSPQHLEARKARARAWRVLEPQTVASAPRLVEPADQPTPHPAPGQRFLLWIDGVGGYLVCLGNHVTLGQATPDAYVDIPLFADVSRIHASLTRDTEGYVLEATRPLQVNHQTVDRALLQSGDRVTLGTSCQLRFWQPVPVSASARLDLVSGHRLPIAVDGVLLMADTLVLGPDSQVHVSMPDLEEPIVLYRHKDGLGVRHSGNITIDGQRHTERGLLGAKSTVTGEDFAFTIEPVGTELGQR
jgi:tetratricopeptide (TPR) repeat protein